MAKLGNTETLNLEVLNDEHVHGTITVDKSITSPTVTGDLKGNADYALKVKSGGTSSGQELILNPFVSVNSATTVLTESKGQVNSVSVNKINVGSADSVTGGQKGSLTQPVYFDSTGKPQPVTYSLNKTVPSNAKFTDTKYSEGTAINITGSGESYTVAVDLGTAHTQAAYGDHGHVITNISGLSAALSNKVETSLLGKANGVATLDKDGLVPSSQLPSYVDDVLEFATKAEFPSTGESAKIYVDLETNLTYRWSGTAYVEISKSLALGTTHSTAAYGDEGKTAYAHSQITTGNPHGTKPKDIGITVVNNTADSKKNVFSATKWTTPISITLGTDAEGSVTLDGSTNVTLPVTVKNDSHTHIISNISNLGTGWGTVLAGNLTPSVTELNYVDGVTSGIQGQLNGKQAKGNYVTTDTDQTISSQKTFTQPIRVSNANGVVVNSNNIDLKVWEVVGNSGKWTSEFGFYEKYNGAASSNDNTLVLTADNQSGAHLPVRTVYQDGTVVFHNGVTFDKTITGNISGSASSATNSTNAAHLKDDSYDYTATSLNYALSEKSDTSHTHKYAASESIGGSASSTKGTFKITSGSTVVSSFNGSANKSVNIISGNDAITVDVATANTIKISASTAYVTSEENARKYASSALQSKTDAGNSATASENSAIRSEKAAQDIDGHKTTAASAASQATESARIAGLKASDATNSATTASQQATNAANSATTASQQAEAATSDASTANNKALAASGSAKNAAADEITAHDKKLLIDGYETASSSNKLKIDGYETASAAAKGRIDVIETAVTEEKNAALGRIKAEEATAISAITDQKTTSVNLVSSAGSSAVGEITDSKTSSLKSISDSVDAVSTSKSSALTSIAGDVKDVGDKATHVNTDAGSSTDKTIPYLVGTVNTAASTAVNTTIPNAVSAGEEKIANAAQTGATSLTNVVSTVNGYKTDAETAAKNAKASETATATNAQAVANHFADKANPHEVTLTQALTQSGVTSGSNGQVLKKTATSYAWSSDNNTTYSFGEGTVNGQFTVTPDGGSATGVKIHGLGTAAYKNSETFQAAGSYVVTNPTSGATQAIAGPLQATSFEATSARKYKENIYPTHFSGLGVLSNVDIVDFNYKSDINKNPKVGLIADDCPAILATPERDAMDMMNCIGILMKSVQELNDKVDKLESLIRS